MICLLDVNVLISLLDSDHPAHDSTRIWFEQHHDLGWATCPITENGCVRIMSSTGYANPLPAQEVADVLRHASRLSNHHFWPDDISILESSHVDLRHVQGSKQLLALAVKNDGRLVTRDSAIPLHAVKGAQASHLLVL